eukprot:m.225804 g.225804  ORF g.225804 m.225804 type:complete len:66 (+) comp15654_c0_seq3:1070-1267(+)
MCACVRVCVCMLSTPPAVCYRGLVLTQEALPSSTVADFESSATIAFFVSVASHRGDGGVAGSPGI